MIRIDIKSLEPGIHTYEWSPEADGLELDPEVFNQVHVAAQLDYHPTRILVTIQTSAIASLTCDRTLVKFDEKVTGEHSVLFASNHLNENEKEPDDAVRLLAATDEEIDLTDLVRDTFILSIPARKIAPGAELEEIPLKYGETQSDSAVDPRWEALRKLSSQGSDIGEDPPEE